MTPAPDLADVPDGFSWAAALADQGKELHEHRRTGALPPERGFLPAVAVDPRTLQDEFASRWNLSARWLDRDPTRVLVTRRPGSLFNDRISRFPQPGADPPQEPSWFPAPHAMD
jgi:hypothetical protein